MCYCSEFVDLKSVRSDAKDGYSETKKASHVVHCSGRFIVLVYVYLFLHMPERFTSWKGS